jgi:hypothetical protein
MTIKSRFQVSCMNVFSCGTPPAVKDKTNSEKEESRPAIISSPALSPQKSRWGCLRISLLQMKFRKHPTPYWLEDFRLEIQGLQHPDMQKLHLHKANVGRGVSGSISIFKDKTTGREFAGKFSHSPPNPNPKKGERDELVSELEAYKTVYEKGGAAYQYGECLRHCHAAKSGWKIEACLVDGQGAWA